MGKRKAKNKTLTKIDPGTLKSKPLAVSQHATHKGTRVTTVINPVSQSPLPSIDPLGFDLDLTNFNEEHLGETISEEDVSRAYYVSRVCGSYRSWGFKTDHYQDNPLLLWRTERKLFLEEFIRLEGRGVFTDDHCELCRKEGMFRCTDCVAVQFLCGGCMSRVHSFNPFHVIEVSSRILYRSLYTILTSR